MATHNRFLSFFWVIVKALGGPHDWPQSPIWKIKRGQRLCSVGQIVVHLEDHVQTAISYNLWRKLVCFVLFCSYEIHRTRMLQMVSLCRWKASMRRGAWAWSHDVWTCSAKVLEYWMISSLKIKLNCSWKFRRNWNVPWVLLERSWWTGIYGICLVRFGFRMWELLILKWFLLLKIQINSKKPGFGRKNQLRTW